MKVKNSNKKHCIIARERKATMLRCLATLSIGKEDHPTSGNSKRVVDQEGFKKIKAICNLQGVPNVGHVIVKDRTALVELLYKFKVEEKCIAVVSFFISYAVNKDVYDIDSIDEDGNASFLYMYGDGIYIEDKIEEPKYLQDASKIHPEVVSVSDIDEAIVMQEEALRKANNLSDEEGISVYMKPLYMESEAEEADQIYHTVHSKSVYRREKIMREIVGDTNDC